MVLNQRFINEVAVGIVYVQGSTAYAHLRRCEFRDDGVRSSKSPKGIHFDVGCKLQSERSYLTSAAASYFPRNFFSEANEIVCGEIPIMTCCFRFGLITITSGRASLPPYIS